jgi:hypothetical protein
MTYVKLLLIVGAVSTSFGVSIATSLLLLLIGQTAEEYSK